MPPYDIILSELSLERIINYKNNLISKETKPGGYLSHEITKHVDRSGDSDKSLNNITDKQFIQLLLSTKKPMIFAESDIKWDDTDWNREELKVLGDVSVSMEVDVYDNGCWYIDEERFKMHDTPFKAKLIFTSGALLETPSINSKTTDYEEIVENGIIVQEKYNKLIERRLLPGFTYSNYTAKKENKNALIVLPGIGCGVFSGEFHGGMGERLNIALKSILNNYGKFLTHVKCVFFDPYSECNNSENIINGITYRVRLNVSKEGKPQLSSVNDFEEHEGEFRECVLYKFVAWDHVSLPGNDYFGGSRNTDDGVSAASTNSMEIITGINGVYRNGGYLPPEGYNNWKQVAKRNNTKLIIDKNVYFSTSNCTFMELDDYHENMDTAISNNQASKPISRKTIGKKCNN